ncbi:MAG: B12-binding domain-containing radical SAM protein [Candidatus Micrarchaeia archaeon]
MTKYVLVADSTLAYTYRDFPLLDFLPSAPSNAVPKRIWKFLKGKPPTKYPDGQLLHAPYSLRKLEAALLKENKREDVAVTDITEAYRFIKEDTEIIGVSTMDPLGIGPLTMSYAVLFGSQAPAWVRVEFEELIAELNRLRQGKKAKLVVGGPGVWDFTVLNEDFKKMNIDYAIQGETEDVINELFRQIATDSIDYNMFLKGYTTFDENFKFSRVNDEKFIGRTSYAAAPKLEEIPLIQRPVIKDMVEIMRGCGVGCDFCEVTLKPLRYYTLDMIKKEVEVNVKEGGSKRAWLHTDEFFGYMHGKFFEPNQDVLIDLFKTMMSIPGVNKTNPTHGRISIPAGYPELLQKLSEIVHASRRNWISVQTGLETGSEELARKHMPNKTLPLRIGPDGSWWEIVWNGVRNETKYFWRSAFTVQVGQEGETDEDNWDTIALVNKLSNSYVDGKPFEFTVTPMLNVPMGRIKSRKLNTDMLNPVMLGVYYATYRHLAKIASRDVGMEARGNALVRGSLATTLYIGSRLMLKFLDHMMKKKGVDVDKVKNYGIEHNKHIESINEMNNA